MRFTLSDKSKTLHLVSAFMLLGYNACGGTTGMGFLQAAEGVTIDNILTLCPPRTAYPAGCLEVYGDYVAGRMMKTRITFNEAEGWVDISDSAPTPDYQGWCSGEPQDPGVRMAWRIGGGAKGKKFASYRDLLAAAADSIGMSVSLEGNQIVCNPTHIPRTAEEIEETLAANPIEVRPLKG